MGASKQGTEVDACIIKHSNWVELFEPARIIFLSLPLEETIKWGMPTYTYEGKNVLGMAGFKHHCAIWFHNGAFLQDAENKLLNAQAGRTRGLRQWRFEQGDKLPAALVKSYAQEAIENERAGKAIKPQQSKLAIPSELAAALNKSRALAQAFAKLSPGKQREFASHIGSAKQAATRLLRLEKSKPLILSGAGLNDKYKRS
jgi:uncharacterized protein YdeI (YjbR/CyaY-like superfamily)